MSSSKGLRLFILRKCAIIIVVFTVSLVSIYFKGQSLSKHKNPKQSKEQSILDSSEDSFYFLTDERSTHGGGGPPPLPLLQKAILKKESQLSSSSSSSDHRVKRSSHASQTLLGANNEYWSTSWFKQKQSNSYKYDNQNYPKTLSKRTEVNQFGASDGQSKVTRYLKSVKRNADDKPDESRPEIEGNNKAETSTTLAEKEAGQESKTGLQTGEIGSSSESNIVSSTVLTTDLKAEPRNPPEEKEESDTTEEEKEPSSETGHTKHKTMANSKVLIHIVDARRKRNCTHASSREFPEDIFGDTLRKHGFILIHIGVAVYMFYCLAVVCDHYFLPSLEECSQRLNLTEDVAGATFMAAGSSAPELFTAILGVFVAKGDVGTGTIVGSAVFNILFVIGLCGILSVTTPLNWWPVARDSSYYTFTVLLLILVAYDGEVTTFESSTMLIFYVVYIVIMHFNVQVRDLVIQRFNITAKLKADELESLKSTEPQQHSIYYQSFQGEDSYDVPHPPSLPPSQDIYKMSLYEAANVVIIKHKRLFPPLTRFRSAANLIIVINSKRKNYNRNKLHNAFAKRASMTSICLTSQSFGPKNVPLVRDLEQWRKVPDPTIEGWLPVIRYCVEAPLQAALFYTIPNCKTRPNLFLLTFFVAIFWTGFFSYIMVWMVTVIGYTFGIPDTVMGITFLAAGTSVPDAYASIHVAKLGQADMAVSNSIGSNVFDILVGLALPWFLETAVFYPGTTGSINSEGLFYAMILLLLSLLVTIVLFYYNDWTLNSKLGAALIFSYVIFLIACTALEFNLLGEINPSTLCPPPAP